MPSRRVRAGLAAGLGVIAIILIVLSTHSPSTPAREARPQAPITPITPSLTQMWIQPPTPQVVSWGGFGDQLAVVVRNTSAQQIVRAQLLIIALDRAGHPLLVTSGQPNSTCCALYDIAPGGEYGAFATIKAPLSEVSSLRAEYVDLTTADAPLTGDEEQVTISGIDFDRTADDAIVSATVRTSGKVSSYLSGQAYLVSPSGHLVGVISGRFYCFGPGAVHRLHMQLLHPVPGDTRVSKVVARPLPAGIRGTSVGSCSSPNS